MRLTLWLTLTLIAGCGNRASSSASCDEPGTTPSPSYDFECQGNVGCSKRSVTWTCSCHCALCGDERCLSAICDDWCLRPDVSVDPVRLDGGPGQDDRSAPDRQKVDVKKLDLPVKTDAPCVVPKYPSDCSQVSYFQCGFSASCNGSVLKVEWHEHVMCLPSEIVPFTCTYTCPGKCVDAGGWPQSGTELVQQYCQP
jgi:hypothetical protein